MANLNTATIMVAKYIITMGLYNFQSLSEETKKKLIHAYGKNFGARVNAKLAL